MPNTTVFLLRILGEADDDPLMAFTELHVSRESAMLSFAEWAENQIEVDEIEYTEETPKPTTPDGWLSLYQATGMYCIDIQEFTVFDLVEHAVNNKDSK